MSDVMDRLKKSALSLFNHEQELTAFALDVIGDINRRSIKLLIDAANNDLNETLSLGNERRILNSMQAIFESAAIKLVRGADSVLKEVYETQFQAVPQEVLTFSQKYPATNISKAEQSAIRALEPRVNAQLIRQAKEATLKRLKSVPQSISDDIQVRLARGVLRGDSIGRITMDIQGTGISKGTFQTAEDRAQVIAITETTNIAAMARDDSLAQINAKLPPKNQLDEKWISLLDGSTSSRCRSLNGQVVKHGELFVASDGWKGRGPAAHPRCRSQKIAWHEAWNAVAEEINNEINSQTKLKLVE